MPTFRRHWTVSFPFDVPGQAEQPQWQHQQHPVGSPRRTSCSLGRCLCTRLAFPVFHLALPPPCHCFRFALMSLSLSLFLWPILTNLYRSSPTSPHLADRFLSSCSRGYGEYVCARSEKRTGANSRCIVFSERRRATVQSASRICDQPRSSVYRSSLALRSRSSGRRLDPGTRKYPMGI